MATATERSPRQPYLPSDSREMFPGFPHLGEMLDTWFSRGVPWTELSDKGDIARKLFMSTMEQALRFLSYGYQEGIGLAEQRKLISDARYIILEVGNRASNPYSEHSLEAEDAIRGNLFAADFEYQPQARAIKATAYLTFGYLATRGQLYPSFVRVNASEAIRRGARLLVEEVIDRRKAAERS